MKYTIKTAKAISVAIFLVGCIPLLLIDRKVSFDSSLIREAWDILKQVWEES